MKFTKVQGAGNDFILVEAGELALDWPQVAGAMCDRHFGVGGDGLLLVLPSDTADFEMRIFNPDGSEAEACGNGLRCLAKYIIDQLRNGSNGKANQTRTVHIQFARPTVTMSWLVSVFLRPRTPLSNHQRIGSAAIGSKLKGL